jgi:hypothetical protein
VALTVIVSTDQRLNIALTFFLAPKSAAMWGIFDESEFAWLHYIIVRSSAILTKSAPFQVGFVNTQAFNAIGRVLDFRWKFEDVNLFATHGSTRVALVSKKSLEYMVCF